MISPKVSLVLTGVALALSLALAADWLAAEWFDVGSPWARGCLLVISLAGAGTWLALLLGRQRRMLYETLAHLDLLSRIDNARLAQAGGDPAIGELPTIDVWDHVSRRLTKRLSSLAQRVVELEGQQAEFDSRVRRHDAQTQRIRSVLSALGEPVLVIDKRDHLVLTNSSANRLFALDADSAETCTVDNLADCDRLAELLTSTRKCRKFTQRSSEIELVDPNGATRWFRVTARNIPTQPGQSDPDGTSQGVVAVLHDITAQKSIQKRNAELVSAVSHEMRTPLAGIKAYLELLADGDADDEAAEEQFLQVIADDADRLQNLVDHLVELARIEADLAGASKQVLLLRDVLEEAAENVRSQADAKDIRLQSDLENDDASALLDRRLIVRAAELLLDNALQYTPEGGQVHLRAYAADSEACFEVNDTGIGLPADQCQKIFDKFYRVAGQTDPGNGTGLGLALVKHIVEDVHAGRIELESTPGEGSTFRVCLPLAGNDAWAQPPATQRHQRATQESRP